MDCKTTKQIDRFGSNRSSVVEETKCSLSLAHSHLSVSAAGVASAICSRPELMWFKCDRSSWEMNRTNLSSEVV